MPIGLLAMLIIGGLFFGFLLSQLLKVRLSNVEAKFEEDFRSRPLTNFEEEYRGRPVTDSTRAEPFQSELPAALAPAASERELVSVSLVFPNDYKHSASIIRVNLMHGDTMVSTWSTVAIGSVETLSLALKGCLSENQLPADLTLVAHAIVDRESLDMRDCLVDIRPGDYFAESVVLVNADAPTAISVNMQRLPA